MSSLKKQIAFLKKLSLSPIFNIKIRYHAQGLLNEILKISLKHKKTKDFNTLKQMLEDKHNSDKDR